MTLCMLASDLYMFMPKKLEIFLYRVIRIDVKGLFSAARGTHCPFGLIFARKYFILT